MKKRYTLGYTMAATEKVAQDIVKQYSRPDHFISAYAIKKYQPHYTPWTSRDGKESCFIVWHPVYYYV